MSSMRRRAAGVGLAAVLGSLGFAGVAAANNNTPPTLKAPRPNARVHAGRITFKVYDPGLSGDSAPVFVAVNRRRQVGKYGLLNGACHVNQGCDFFTMKRWRRHPGWWIYTSPPNTAFPGWYASTPGRYFWQAEHTAPLCDRPGCEIHSAIRSFRVYG